MFLDIIKTTCIGDWRFWFRTYHLLFSIKTIILGQTLKKKLTNYTKLTIVEINFYDFGLLRINILKIDKNQQKIAFNKLFFRNY